MKHPRITVVTPSFNKAITLPRTINSVISQKYPNLEYLIMDAGSTDGSRDIIRKFAQKYSWIKFIFKKDRGQWDAVNQGFHKSTGDLLGFINADDQYADHAFVFLAEAYRMHPEGLWYAGKGRIVDDQDASAYELVSLYKNFLLSINRKVILQIVNYLVQPSVFITRKAFTRIGDFLGDGKYIMEYDSWLKLAEINMPVVVSHYLSLFRMSPGMASLNNATRLLAADTQIVSKYTHNKTVMFLHRAHNLGRTYVSKI